MATNYYLSVSFQLPNDGFLPSHFRRPHVDVPFETYAHYVPAEVRVISQLSDTFGMFPEHGHIFVIHQAVDPDCGVHGRRRYSERIPQFDDIQYHVFMSFDLAYEWLSFLQIVFANDVVIADGEPRLMVLEVLEFVLQAWRFDGLDQLQVDVVVPKDDVAIAIDAAKLDNNHKGE